MSIDELYANYCIYCNKEIALFEKMCQDCEDKQINREDDEAEDDELFKEK